MTASQAVVITVLVVLAIMIVVKAVQVARSGGKR